MKVSGDDYIPYLRNETENWGELTFAKICGIVTVTAEEPVSRKSCNFFGPGKLFCVTMFSFKIKDSVILKMIQRNYELTKQKSLFCGPGTKLRVNRL